MMNDLERVTANLGGLFKGGAVSDESAAILRSPTTALAIENGLGQSGEGGEVLLVAILVDDSTSVATNLAEIHLGYDAMIEALRAETATAHVQVLTRTLNRGVLSPYAPLDVSRTLTAQGYDGSRLVPETPLYLQSLLILGTVMAKAQEEKTRGAQVRTFTLIISDAADNASDGTTAQDVKVLVTDMLDFANNHIVAGMGVGEHPGINFYEIFAAMGIPKRWRLSAGVGADGLRGRFHTVVRSLTLAAASEVGFAQLLPGPPSES